MREQIKFSGQKTGNRCFIYVVNLALRKKGSDFQKSSFLFPFSKVEVDCI
jgi:hypothetical protein